MLPFFVSLLYFRQPKRQDGHHHDNTTVDIYGRWSVSVPLCYSFHRHPNRHWSTGQNIADHLLSSSSVLSAWLRCSHLLSFCSIRNKTLVIYIYVRLPAWSRWMSSIKHGQWGLSRNCLCIDKWWEAFVLPAAFFLSRAFKVLFLICREQSTRARPLLPDQPLTGWSAEGSDWFSQPMNRL